MTFDLKGWLEQDVEADYAKDLRHEKVATVLDGLPIEDLRAIDFSLDMGENPTSLLKTAQSVKLAGKLAVLKSLASAAWKGAGKPKVLKKSFTSNPIKQVKKVWRGAGKLRNKWDRLSATGRARAIGSLAANASGPAAYAAAATLGAKKIFGSGKDKESGAKMKGLKRILGDMKRGAKAAHKHTPVSDGFRHPLRAVSETASDLKELHKHRASIVKGQRSYTAGALLAANAGPLTYGAAGVAGATAFSRRKKKKRQRPQYGQDF